MVPYQQLRDQVVKLGRLHPADLADRWIRAVASVLADWGGEAARRALGTGLPAQIFRGPGTGGLSWERAVAQCREEGEATALAEEVGRRTGEPDPTKVALNVRLIVGLFKESLAADQVAALAAALPAPVAEVVRETSPEAPWRFRLIPQSYARPARVGPRAVKH